MTPAVLIAEPEGYSPVARAALEQVARVDAIACDRAALLARIGDYEALVTRFAVSIDREVLTRGRRLRAVAIAATGLDHVDLVAAREAGVAILSLVGEVHLLRTIPATAELTWALVLALSRQVVAAVQHTRSGGWERNHFRGHDLAGKRFGVLGCGRVGSQVAGYAKAFGMRVLAYDPRPDNTPPWLERRRDAEALAAESDVFSVHVPLSSETRGLVGARVFERLPFGALFVNTSRGAVVDESALLEALDAGRLAGAALDVVADEVAARTGQAALLAESARRPNLLLTPHIGGATVESMARTELFVAQRLAQLLAGVPR